MAATVLPHDDHFLGLGALLTVALQLACFAVAWTCQFDLITDFAGSLNFILLALLALFGGGAFTPRGILIVSLAVITRAELGAFLLYRVLRRGKDERFDTIRTSFFAFLVFWIFQMVWAWGVSLPVLFVGSDAAATPLGSRDWAGLGLWALGFLVQVTADVQKDAFRADPANKGRVCDVGVWRWSRHPNFFGEIALWWGIFLASTPQFDASASSWGYACVISPLLTMLILLKGSGMPTAEGDNQKRFLRTQASRAAYLEYRAKTSPLLPLPRSLYFALPKIVKQVALFEWPSYEMDWEYCGEGAALEPKVETEEAGLRRRPVAVPAGPASASSPLLQVAHVPAAISS